MHAFDKLMKRIDWSAIPKDNEEKEAEDETLDEAATMEVDEETQHSKNSSCLVWAGYLPSSSFSEFSFDSFANVDALLHFLETKGLASFWKLALHSDLKSA